MNQRFRTCCIALSSALALAWSALAVGAELSLLAPYVRMVPPGTANTAAFLTIRNKGSTDHKLLRADSPAARAVELHTHLHDQGVMRMRQVAAIDLKATSDTELKPGGYHVMLIDLRQTLREGDSVSLSLSFDDGSTMTVDAPVRRP